MLLSSDPSLELEQALIQLSQIANDLPGVVIIHDLQGTVIWMSDRGLNELGISLEQVTQISAAEYYRTYFNEEDAKDYVPKILSLLERNNDDEVCTYFQQVRYGIGTPWTWHFTSTKVWRRDKGGLPVHTITMSFPLESMHHMAAKADRLLEENNFLRNNIQQYATLSKRERQVLKLLAMGKTAHETADELFISIDTVESHRKKIRQKLNTSSHYTLGQYARAFDLI